MSFGRINCAIPRLEAVLPAQLALAVHAGPPVTERKSCASNGDCTALLFTGSDRYGAAASRKRAI